MNLTPVQYRAVHNGFNYKFTYVANKYWSVLRYPEDKVEIPPYCYCLTANGFDYLLTCNSNLLEFKNIEEAVAGALKASDQ